MRQCESIPRHVRARAHAAPARPSVTCEGRTATRGEVEARSNRLAREYEALGVRLGDTVAITLPNSIDFAVAALAAWKVGAAPLPLSHRMPRPELTAILELARPALVVGVEGTGHPTHRCLPVEHAPDPSIDDSAFVPDRVSPVLRVLTTGGSTGRPKLLVSTQPGVVDVAGSGAFFGMPDEGAILVPNPLHHGSAFHFLMLGLCLGKHVVLLSRFDAEAALDAITRHRVDWTFLVPTMMSRMLRAIEAEPDRYDLAPLQMVWHGAATCPVEVKRAWVELLGPDRITELYGASEAPLSCTMTGREWLGHPGSVGRPRIGAIKVCAEDGREVAPGEVGEIFMRAPDDLEPHVMLVGAELKDVGGWKSVGDLGRVDDDGYLYISDRRVDMIVSGGANVFPAEVESALVQHPRVVRAVVVGLPDDDLGQRVHALVEPDGVITVHELLEFLADRLVPYKLPRSIRLVDEPLRDDTDKVRRSALRDREIDLLATEVVP